jgi:hypothetical protein
VIAAGSGVDSVGTVEMAAVLDLALDSAGLASAPKLLAQDFVVVSVVLLRGRGTLCDGKVSFH